MIPTLNDLSCGCKGDTIYAFTNGTDIFAIHDIVKDALDYPSVMTYNFWNLRQSFCEQETLRLKFPFLSESAYEAIFDANLRGVKVCLMTFIKQKKVDEYKAISLREMMISILREKDFKKILSILKNYNLDNLLHGDFSDR